MTAPDESGFDADYLHPAEPHLDTAEEQAQALLLDLRDSFAPSYLTLISIIQGVLLGLMFQLLADGRPVLRPLGVAAALVANNVVVIALVWNEYRMGSAMFRWVPSLLDAVIPFVVGGLQAALILSVGEPLAWLGWLATFYLAGVAAFENMYRRAAEEQRNAFVLGHNRTFRRLNVAASLGLSLVLWGLFAAHAAGGTSPGVLTLAVVTILNAAFLVRGEANSRRIVRAARRAGLTRAG